MQAIAPLPPASALPWSRLGDEALARRAAAGNKAAFSALYERYYGPLLGYCRSILLDSEDASDATQSALENALRCLPRREPGRPLKPWLYRIAHNEAINIVRRRQLHAPESEIDNLLSVPGPDVDAEQRGRLTQLVDDLRALPERQRGALVMRELSGLSYDEISLALGISQEGARRAVYDARTALHDAVDGRATECVSVRHCLSDGDRRSVRTRRIRAHLRSCNDCASFQRAIGMRRNDLHLLGPWLPGAGMAGLLGIGAGAGTAGGGALLATGGGASVGVGGGLGWASLPVAMKGLAVAAAVATTGTAAVEIEKVATPEPPAPRTAQVLQQPASARHSRASSAAALSAATPRSVSLRARRTVRAALAQVGMSSAAASGRPTSTPQSLPALNGAAPRPAPAQSTPPVAARNPATAPQRSAVAQPVAKTPEQIAIDKLTAIKDEIRRAIEAAQATAASGTSGALQTAQAVLQDVLASLRGSLDRVLATVGLRLPAPVAAVTEQPTTQPAATPTTLLAPVNAVLDGVNSLLQKLFGRT